MKTPDILITDAYLLPEPGTEKVIDHGYVSICDNLITGIGTMANLGDTRARKVIDARGDLVMPGLVNTHCHAPMTLFRGLADDLELVSWLKEYIFPAEAKHVNPEVVYWCSRLAAAEMLLSGTTMVADAYFFENEVARAFSEAGLRAVAAQGIIDFPAPGVPDPLDNVRSAARFLDAWKGRDQLITPAVFAHAPYTCSADTLQKAKKESRLRGKPFFIHVAETRAEQSLIRDARGTTPVKHLEALGILDPLTVCVHCIWVDEDDINILSRCKVKVVLCPQSHMKLASGMAPLADMLAQSIVVGLGTDGAASNNSLDLFREMDICAKMQKVRMWDPVAVRAENVLKMATSYGAEILGLAGQCGILRAGGLADLIVVDRNSPNLNPFYGPDLLVYGAKGSDVRSVIVNGRLVVHDKQVLSMDLNETLDRVRYLAGFLI